VSFYDIIYKLFAKVGKQIKLGQYASLGQTNLTNSQDDNKVVY